MDEALERARIHLARGDLGPARNALDSVLSREAENPEALLLRAHLLHQSGEEEPALEAYERAVRSAPRSAEALNGMARCLHALSRDEEALVAAQKALDVLDEGDNFRQAGPVYLTLVWCLREMHRLREALSIAEQGLGRSQDSILAQWASVVEEELAEAEKERC